jgi:Fe-Mn family superoxide dismutase
MAITTIGNGASTMAPASYQAREWAKLSGLQGISDHTLDVHFELYKGYVKHVNLFNEELADLARAPKSAGKEDLRTSELKRRLPFEYNGMRLHEYYFDNLTSLGKGDAPAGRLRDTLGASYGGYDEWKRDFVAVGTMRGVGWAIAYQDPTNGRVSNHWIESHQDGNLAGFRPIVVMDVWEHAYMLDYKPTERGKYIEAFFENIAWEVCESRLVTPK